MAVTKRIAKRLSSALKQFQPIIKNARARDLNESDTVTIVTDMLSDVFGYDKYAEVTSEYAIRSSYCDLAIKIKGRLALLLEIKAIGTDLKYTHTKQAVDYAANEGTEWVILTNAVTWQVFHITFAQPIDADLILQIDMLDLDSRSEADVETLYILSREGLQRSALEEYHEQCEATNKYVLGALVLSEPSVKLIRRELRRLSPGLKVSTDEVRDTLAQEVLKRDVVDAEEGEEYRKKVAKGAAKKPSRRKQSAPPQAAESPGLAGAPTDPSLPLPEAPSEPRPPQ